MSPRTRIIAMVTTLVLATAAGPVHAQEVALTVGRLLGDDLIDSDILPTDFSDATLFGVRAGTSLLLVDVEASLLIGNSELFEDTAFATDARFTYLEGSAVLRLLPGPIAPFVAAGLGLHRIALDGPGDLDHSTLGYNFGAGLKIALGSLGVRADLRDHVTPMDLEDLPPDLVDALGLDESETLHNFEISAGLIVRF